MTSLRVALTELKRFSPGVLPKLVMIALICIPLLYGGMYLYSNWDPYGKVDHVSGALVMEDTGATTGEGEQVNTGEEVADDLRSSADFDWHDVSTRDDAVQEVSSGDIDFALVIPEDFSERLLSTSRFAPAEDGTPGEVDPQQAGLEVITNDANNYLLTNIVKQAGGTVRDSVARQVGDETAGTMLANLTTIHGQLSEATDGSQQVTDGAVSLSDAVDQLKDGTSSLASGATQLNDGALALLDGQNQLVDGNRTALDGARQLDDGAHRLSDGASTLAGGTATLSQGASELHGGTGELSSGASQLAEGTSSLSDGAGQLSDGATALNGALEQSGLSSLSGDLNAVCADLSQANDAAPTGRLGADASQAVLSEVDGVAAQRVQGLVSDGTLTQEQADSLVKSLSDEDARSRITDAATRGLDQVEQTPLGSGLQQFRDSGCASDGTSRIASQIDELSGAVSQLGSGASDLAQGARDADSAAQQLATGAGTLNEKTGELAEGAQQVDQGAQDLSSGASELSENTGSLVSGAQQLLDGQEDARDGAQQLAEGTGQAVDGSAQLDEGAGQLQGGSGDLRAGSQQLTDELRDGAGQVPDLSASDQDSLSAVMSDPVSDEHDSLAGAGSYGEGMGPFFMILALWIGLLMAGQFLRAGNSRALASNASSLRIALGAWTPFALVGLAQGVLLFTVVKFALGFDMAHPWLAFWFFLFTSVVFSAICQGLIALLEAPGKLVVLILLVLQLVTAGGMMPYQTLPAPLEWMHHALPMSHALTGLRRLIYGIDTAAVWPTVALLAGFLVLGLLLGFLGAVKDRTWTLKKLNPEVEL
jgi:putative membrane protein